MKARRRSRYARLGAAEVAILTTSAIVGAGLFWFPGTIADVAGAGVVLAYLIDSALMILVVAAIVALVRRHPGQRMVDLMSAIAGPWLTRIVVLLIAALDLGVAVVTVLGTAVVLTAVFLPLTPLWAIEAAVTAVVTYSVAQGIEPLARGLDVIIPVTWLVLLVEAVLVAGQAREPVASLLPRLPAVGGGHAVLAGAYVGLWLLSGVTAIPNIAAHLAPDQLQRLRSRVGAGVAFSVLLRGGLLALDLLVLGVVGTAWYQWPSVSLLRQSRANLLTNRTGALAVVLLLVLVWAFVAVRVWNAATNLQDVLAPTAHRGDRTVTRPSSLPGGRWGIAVALGLLILAVCLLAKSVADLPGAVTAWLDLGTLVLALALPAVLWLVDTARGRRPRPI